jgi:hypothetical protein
LQEDTAIEERELYQGAVERSALQRKEIPRLVDMCVDSVCANIKHYDSLGGLCDTYAFPFVTS